MAEQLKVITKSVDLMEYTYRATENKEFFPIKYKTLIYRMQNLCLDIYHYSIAANRLNATLQKQDRIILHTRAITACDELSCLIELSHSLNRINIKKMEIWQNKINDVKNLTLAWRTSDSKR